MVGKYESIGIEEAEEQNRSTQANFERTKQEELQQKGDLKFARGEKHVLEDQRKKLIQVKNRFQEELKKEERKSNRLSIEITSKLEWIASDGEKKGDGNFERKCLTCHVEKSASTECLSCHR